MLKNFNKYDYDNLNVVFDYVYKRNKYDSNYLISVISAYQKNVVWVNWIVRSVVNVLSIFMKPPQKNVKYYFLGNNYEELILSLPSSDVCVIGGPRQWLFCLKNRCSFMPSMRFWKPLLTQLKSPHHNNNESLKKEIILLAKNLEIHASNNSFFIVSNDSLPMERAAIIAAKLSGVSRTVCVQHGIFQSTTNRYIIDGWFADLFLAFDDHQKALLTKIGIDSEKIRVMGFHSSPYLPKRQVSEELHRRVCFIGQPWGKYDRNKEVKYLDIVEKVKRLIVESNGTYYFKPHPWESQASYINNFSKVVNISMKEAIERYDVFVSLTSTALYEACWSGRIAIQIYDELFNADRFSNMSNIITLDYECENFENRLLSIVNHGVPCIRREKVQLKKRFLDSITESKGCSG